MAESEYGLPILLIDNYDSYTYNLFHLIAQANHNFPPTVLKNDQISLSPDKLKDFFCAIVISPGPGTPNNEKVQILSLNLIQILIFEGFWTKLRHH